jgi:hypothetical protein
MNELEYKVVKAIFSVNKIEQVDQINIPISDIELNDIDLNDVTKINNFSKNQKKSNPLFMNPNDDPNSRDI